MGGWDGIRGCDEAALSLNGDGIGAVVGQVRFDCLSELVDFLSPSDSSSLSG